MQAARNEPAHGVGLGDKSAIPLRPAEAASCRRCSPYSTPRPGCPIWSWTRFFWLGLAPLIRQQTQRDLLRPHGKTPSCKLLLAGPPGSGKTMTAAALAGELHLPLFSVRLDALITRYMGDTAAKLRLIFDQIGNTRGVYLFDEFDAIGSHRSADNDVGEMRRVLNSFLQFMEERSTTALSSQRPTIRELLDRALGRRLDEVIA